MDEKRQTYYFKSREENLAKIEILALNFKSCSHKNIWIYIHEMCWETPIQTIQAGKPEVFALSYNTQ